MTPPSAPTLVPGPVETYAPGHRALPLPPGDPAVLWRATTTLRAAAAAATGSTLASGPPGLLGSWDGAAARAASDEVLLVGARVRDWADRTLRAAVLLGRYADQLDAAQRAVTTLQATWNSVLSSNPLAPPPAPALAPLVAVHEAVTTDLTMAARVAAHGLRALVGEVVAGPDEPAAGARGAGAATGWADPVPTAALVRAVVLAGLPVAAGVADREAATALVGAVLPELRAAAEGDAAAAARAGVALRSAVHDPQVARALWERLDVDATARLVRTQRWAAGGHGPTELSTVLGTALGVAADPALDAGLDPVATSAMRAWRHGWLAALAAAVARPGGSDVAQAQAVLLAAAVAVGVAPGARYAATVGVALVAADRDARRAGGPGQAGDVPPLRPPAHDPVDVLGRALLADGAAARALLLAPLPGGGGRLVVDQLVADGYRPTSAGPGARTLATTTALVRRAGGEPTERSATTLDAALLAAVAREVRATGDPDAYAAALAPALADLGAVLARHVDALPAVLDGSAAPGTDGATAPLAERLTLPGRVTGTWEVVLPGRADTAALLGALALDGRGPGPGGWAPGGGSLVDGHTRDARDPGLAPAVAVVLTALGERLDDDLVAAVRADHAGDPHALDAVGHRLGAAVGFTLTSAGERLAGLDATADARDAAVAALAEGAVAKVAVPGAAGRLATPLVRAAAGHLLDAALPTGSEAAQRAATAGAVAAATEDAYAQVRTQVSRARPWGDDQSPERWAAGPQGWGQPVFWDAVGVPLPEPAMTTAQRRAFTAWRRDEGLTVYDTAPLALRDGIVDGVRSATGPGARP